MQHYFVDKINDSFILKDNDFHHVKNVMRIKNMQEIVCIYDSKNIFAKSNMLHLHIKFMYFMN